MFNHLQISYPRARMLVGLADAALAPLGALRRRGRDAEGPVRRVLLLRLERIGDLLMVLEAIGNARAAWPAAEIDLAVGSWNAELASLIPGVNRIRVADVPWLAREGSGLSWPALIRTARAWLNYDLVLNFEPDIRSNFLAWLTGAPRRFGYWSGGGGAFLTHGDPYEPTSHVAANAMSLVARATSPNLTRRRGGAETTGLRTPEPRILGTSEPRLRPPESAMTRAASILAAHPGPWIGVHSSGGRESKQWHLDRFAEVARTLARERNATVVLTGSPADRPLVDAVKRGLGAVRVIDAAGELDLVVLAALLAKLDLFVTGDTGPMHLAAAVGTPVVALFGPANPRRYGPLAEQRRVVRVDLPCSPCGQVRLPPERCRGHVPDCMDGITVGAVVTAANELLGRAGR
jgi:ADP-heptose:LPS heptosyltransferase